MKRFTLYLIFLSTLILSQSCTESEYDKISRYFYKTHNYNIKSSNVIFVITENSCIGCNKSFARLTEYYLNRDSTIFLVTASGSMVDISSFDNSESNVYFDYSIPSSNKLLNETCAIFLSDKKIDTIVYIKAVDINKQFDYISNQMKD